MILYAFAIAFSPVNGNGRGHLPLSRRDLILATSSASLLGRTLPANAHLSSETETDPSTSLRKDHDIYFYADVEPESILRLQNQLKDFTADDADEINLHIHSPGGSALLGLFASDLIRRSTVPVQTFVDGMAASSASLMSVSGKKRFMTKHSLILMHQPSFEIGHAKFQLIQDEAYNLKLINDFIIDIYATHTSMPKTLIEKCLYNERYLTASECLKYSFIDEII